MTTQHKASSAFWKYSSLSQMSHDEWERLCDGCGRCCLHKLEDEDDGKIYYTYAACALLDIHSCHCQDYMSRQQKMPDCIQLAQEDKQYFDLLPTSCSYRLLAQGKDLPDWHPLITGDDESVHKAGISVRHIARPKSEVTELTEAVIHFPHESE